MEAYSHTTRQLFLTCPRSFYLKKMLRFERDVEPSGLRMGKAMADAVEAAAAGTTPEDEKAMALHSLLRAYYDAIKAGDERRMLEHAQLQVLATAYLDRYRGSLLREAVSAGHSVVMTKREVEFDDPVLGVGRLDAVVKVAGRNIGIEDKLLTPAFWRDSNERKLRIDAQVTAYFAAMRAAGTPLDELRYRVTFKPTIKPNRETLDEYKERLRARVEGERDYAFREYQLYRTDAEMDAFMRRVDGINRSIASAKRKLKTHGEDYAFPMQAGEACNQFGGCEFLDLCAHGPHAAGYRIKPERPKLTRIQADSLRAMSECLHDDGVRVDEVSKRLGKSNVRHAIERLVEMGLATKERRGRAAVYQVTDAGAAYLND